jgi:hypothetical protein
MARCRPTLALLGVALALAAGGCGSGSSTPDSEITEALDLEAAGGGYELGGDPFCVVGELLNDGDEVDGAGADPAEEFLIASPDGEVGVLAQKPFAPDCARRAKADLTRLARKSD